MLHGKLCKLCKGNSRSGAYGPDCGDNRREYAICVLKMHLRNAHILCWSTELDLYSRSPKVGGGASGKAREGLADVISMHE